MLIRAGKGRWRAVVLAVMIQFACLQASAAALDDQWAAVLGQLLNELRARQGCSNHAVGAEQMKGIADTWKKIDQHVSAARQEDISAALPGIVRDLTGDSDEARICAGRALLTISLRPDSAALLRRFVPTIGSLLDSDDERLQGGAGQVLSLLHPQPPPEVVPPLLLFLKRTDRNMQWQAAAAGDLLRIAPDDPNVAAAIQEFWSRKLDLPTRAAILGKLGNPRVRAGLVNIVISSLDDPERAIRHAAAEAMRRMSKEAIMQAEPTLRRLTSDTEELPADQNARRMELEIRDFASQALHLLDSPK